MERLAGIPPVLKKKLITIIEEKNEFLVLKGSDPSIKDGCCPNLEVGTANKLVGDGILVSWSPQPENNTCTMTVYAFRNEIVSVKDNSPVFNIDEGFRQEVLGLLKSTQNSSFSLTPAKAVGIFLLSFSVFCLFWVAFKGQRIPAYTGDGRITNSRSNRVKVYFFHNLAHCESCDKIEKYLQETLNLYFKNELADGLVEYAAVNTDSPDNRHYIKEYNILTRSIVVASIQNNKEKHWKNLDAIWDYLDSRDKFEAYVRKEAAGLLVEAKAAR